MKQTADTRLEDSRQKTASSFKLQASGFMSFVCCLQVCCLLPACVETKTVVTSYDRSRPIGQHTVRQFLYGKTTNDSGLFDEATTGNFDTGFKLMTQFAASLSTAYIAGSVSKAREITAQISNSNLTALQKQQVLSAAQTEAAKAGADLTKFGISNGLFTPQATIFKQPL